MNGGETGVDCGGPCLACLGQSCAANTACASGMCYEAACVASVNGCTIATATDATAMSSVTVTFANGNFTYAPKCLVVRLNNAVVFQGNFTSHPMIGGQVVAGTPTPASSGPFIPATNSGSTKTFTMSSLGTFPYYCQVHAASLGMDGAVFVVP